MRQSSLAEAGFQRSIPLVACARRVSADSASEPVGLPVA